MTEPAHTCNGLTPTPVSDCRACAVEIRMGRPMKIYELTSGEIRDLAADLAHALATGRAVRVASDGGTVKVKIGGDMWTPPLGNLEA